MWPSATVASQPLAALHPRRTVRRGDRAAGQGFDPFNRSRSRLEQLRRLVEPFINRLNEPLISPRVKLTAHQVNALPWWLTSRTLRHADRVQQRGTGTLQLTLPNIHKRKVSQGKSLLSRDSFRNTLENVPQGAFGFLKEPSPKVAGPFVGTDPGLDATKSCLWKEEHRWVL